MVVNTVVDTID